MSAAGHVVVTTEDTMHSTPRQLICSCALFGGLWWLLRLRVACAAGAAAGEQPLGNAA